MHGFCESREEEGTMRALVALLTLASTVGWQIRGLRSRLVGPIIGLALVLTPPQHAVMANEAAQEVVIKAVSDDTAQGVTTKVTIPSIEAAQGVTTKATSPSIEAPAPSWLKAFQTSLQEEAERHLKEREEIERLRTAFEADLDEKRREFETNLELERKQFELDLKKEADLKDTAAQREGNLKYYVSLGVTLTLFALDQSLKSGGKEEERVTRPTKRGKAPRDDSLLD